MSAVRLDPSDSSKDWRFPSTHWTSVYRVRHRNPVLAREALESFCTEYRFPLYAFVRRSYPELSPQDAEDLVQGSLGRLIERRDLELVAPEKGQLRSYLMTGIRNFRIKELTRDRAAKRDRRRLVVLLDSDQAEQLCGPDLREGVSPESAFDRQCIRGRIARALSALREEHRARRKEAWFDTVAPLMSHADPGDYERVAAELGQRRGTVAVAVHRLRARLMVLLRAEYARALGPAGNPDAEIQADLATPRRDLKDSDKVGHGFALPANLGNSVGNGGARLGL